MGSLDGLPSLVGEFRALKSRIAELERTHSRAPAAVVYRAADFSVNSVSAHDVPFTNVLFDPLGMWSASNPTEVILPSTGVYVVIGKTAFRPNDTTGFRDVSVDGLLSGVATTERIAGSADEAAQNMYMSYSNVGWGEAGTAVRLSVQQGSGVNVNVQDSSLAVVYIGFLAGIS